MKNESQSARQTKQKKCSRSSGSTCDSTAFVDHRVAAGLQTCVLRQEERKGWVGKGVFLIGEENIAQQPPAAFVMSHWPDHVTSPLQAVRKGRKVTIGCGQS